MVVVGDVPVDVDVTRVEVPRRNVASGVQSVVEGDSQAVSRLVRIGVEVGDVNAVGAVVSLRHLYKDGSVLVHSVSVGGSRCI